MAKVNQTLVDELTNEISPAAVPTVMGAYSAECSMGTEEWKNAGDKEKLTLIVKTQVMQKMRDHLMAYCKANPLANAKVANSKLSLSLFLEYLAEKVMPDVVTVNLSQEASVPKQMGFGYMSDEDFAKHLEEFYNSEGEVLLQKHEDRRKAKEAERLRLEEEAKKRKKEAKNKKNGSKKTNKVEKTKEEPKSETPKFIPAPPTDEPSCDVIIPEVKADEESSHVTQFTPAPKVAGEKSNDIEGQITFNFN